MRIMASLALLNYRTENYFLERFSLTQHEKEKLDKNKHIAMGMMHFFVSLFIMIIIISVIIIGVIIPAAAGDSRG